MTARLTETRTMLDALVEAILAAGSYNRQDQVEPVAVLWPDEGRLWEPLIPRLRERLPLLTLGSYEPEALTGPAIWLRCVIAGEIKPSRLIDEGPPVLYLPGYSRRSLRAVEDCPREIQPLAELQYRGTLWTHRNGRDWTIAGFLETPDGGLGINVSGDKRTREALQRAVELLADTQVSELRRHAPLRSAWLDSLFNPDEARALLRWLNDPDAFRSSQEAGAWEAFCARGDSTYRFHPEHDGPITAAKMLGEHNVSEWRLVWSRFCEAPAQYPHVPNLLRQARPQRELPLFQSPSSWPQDNEAAEDDLRVKLASLDNAMLDDARRTIGDLEGEHGRRRDWVWATLGDAPLADALEHLALLAAQTAEPVHGTTVEDLATWYTATGWQADWAVIQALSAIDSREDQQAVAKAIRALYRPWLDQLGRCFENAMLAEIAAGTPPDDRRPNYDIPGTCVLFCDAVRFDVGQMIAGRLEELDIATNIDWTLAALPTVTPTAKPAISPAANRISGGDGFDTKVAGSERKVTAPVLRELIKEAGYQILGLDEIGDPSGLAWSEIGAIDQHGHAEGWRISHRLDPEAKLIVDRIAGLLDAGWRRVILVTDHGWQMLPDGLEKIDLPVGLTEVRKGRCARIKDAASVDLPTVPWRWHPNVTIAVAPGVSCFEAGKEYEHGGLSPQECVTPVITATRGGDTGQQAPVTITNIAWTRLRCNVTVDGAEPGWQVDLRTRAGDPTTSLVAAPGEIDTDGNAFLFADDPDAVRTSAILVVTDPNGNVRQQTATIVGG